MKAKFGAIVVDGRGKINGHVASKNRSGAYFRGKVTPVNPSTQAQQGVRSSMATLSKSWGNLTDVQRSAWNSAVASFAKTNIFGDIVNPSGFNLFMKINQVAALDGRDMLSLPPQVANITGIAGASLTARLSPISMIITIDSLGTLPTEFVVYATPQLPAGQSYVKNKMRYIGTFPAAEAVNILSAYQAKFGSLSQVGAKVHCSVHPAELDEGQYSVGVTTSAVITAS